MKEEIATTHPANHPAVPLQPVSPDDRYISLDVLRGLALYGVLMVNLMSDFRIPLAQHMLVFHTHTGPWDRAVDILVAIVLEFKSFALFSLLFGVGVAMQAERFAGRVIEGQGSATRFLARRFLALGAIGAIHLNLIWNGDILTLYAVCGLLLLPFLRWSAAALVVAAAVAIALPYFLPWGIPWPEGDALRNHAEQAMRIYGRGAFGEVLAFRWQETRGLIVPLLVGILPKVFGLMLLGMAAWRSGIVREPLAHRRFLGTVTLLAGSVGLFTATVSALAASSGQPAPPIPRVILDLGPSMLLPLAYGAGGLLWLASGRIPPAITAAFAGLGRMALTNYVAQSVVLSLIFYSCGLGLIGQLGPAVAGLIGTALYFAQMIVSEVWLSRYRFGPLERLWRSLTYGSAR